jgi:hypothetical protein
MKAKEYAEQFEKMVTDGKEPWLGIAEVCRLMLIESKEIVEKRHCQTNEAMVAVVREIEDKFKAFARIVTSKGKYIVKPGGFRAFILAVEPDLWALLKMAGYK